MPQRVEGMFGALTMVAGLVGMRACQPVPDDVAAGGTIPRLEGTAHPDIHGVWQAFSEAEYNLEGQAAQPSAVVHPGMPNGNPVPHAPVLALARSGAFRPARAWSSVGRSRTDRKRWPHATRTVPTR